MRAPALKEAERRVNAVFARIIAVLMLSIGLAFIALFVWASYKVAVLARTPEVGAFVVLAVFATLAAFCSLVGWRLFRPNKYGSVLAPVGWRILGSVFAATALLILVVGVRFQALDVLSGVVFSGTFSWWCFVRAQQLTKEVIGDL
jgi:hypothetical protein